MSTGRKEKQVNNDKGSWKYFFLPYIIKDNFVRETFTRPKMQLKYLDKLLMKKANDWLQFLISTILII